MTNVFEIRRKSTKICIQSIIILILAMMKRVRY